MKTLSVNTLVIVAMNPATSLHIFWRKVFLLHISRVEGECICAFSCTPSLRRKRAEDLLIFKERRFSEEDRLSPPETEERERGKARRPLSPAMCLDRADSAKALFPPPPPPQCSWSGSGEWRKQSDPFLGQT